MISSPPTHNVKETSVKHRLEHGREFEQDQNGQSSPSWPELRRCSPRSQPNTLSLRIPLCFSFCLVGLDFMNVRRKVISFPCFLDTERNKRKYRDLNAYSCQGIPQAAQQYMTTPKRKCNTGQCQPHHVSGTRSYEMKNKITGLCENNEFMHYALLKEFLKSYFVSFA